MSFRKCSKNTQVPGSDDDIFVSRIDTYEGLMRYLKEKGTVRASVSSLMEPKDHTCASIDRIINTFHSTLSEAKPAESDADAPTAPTLSQPVNPFQKKMQELGRPVYLIQFLQYVKTLGDFIAQDPIGHAAYLMNLNVSPKNILSNLVYDWLTLLSLPAT